MGNTAYITQTRESTLPIDQRITFTPDELRRLLTAVRNRIHIEGLNADDQQMAPARSYQSPRGLYRYLTGDLFNSTSLRQEGNALVLRWAYPDVILYKLEDMYGPIFAWSKDDIAEVRELERDKLREAGISFDETELDRLAEIQRAAEAEEVARKRAAAELLADEGAPIDDQAIADNTDDDPVTLPRAFQVSEARLAYDPEARLNANDVTATLREVRRRISVMGLDANGRPIPQAVRDKISNRTFQSLRIVKPAAGVLVMRVRFRDAALPLLMHKYNSPVFGWAPSDVQFVDAIVQTKLPGPPAVQTMPI